MPTLILALLLAAVLSFPNWRYMILATIAGVAYGGVFQRPSSVVSSAALHMLVDWTKHVFF